MSFTHLTPDNRPTMVDVGDKKITARTATARSIVALPEEVLTHFTDGDLNTKKGSVFQTAILAGIMGAKQTANLIPLCHPLALDKVSVDIFLNEKKEVVIEFNTTAPRRQSATLTTEQMPSDSKKVLF